MIKQMLTITCLLLGACGGSEKETEYIRDPGTGVTPTPVPPTPTPGGTTYAEVQKLLNESCGGGSCHAGASFLRSEEALRANSQVRNRVTSDSMPPRYSSNYYLWEDGTRKKTILEFLGSN